MEEKKSDGEMFLEIRQLFKITNNFAYFNSAGQTPLPTPTFESFVNEYRGLYEFGDIFFMEQLAVLEELKKLFAHWTGGVAKNFSLVPSTSQGFNMVARSIKRGAGAGRIKLLSLIDEFPSTTIPFEANGFEMVYLRPREKGSYQLEEMVELMDREKPLGVVLSHIQYGTGFRFDIEKLQQETKKRGMLLLINGTQAMPYFRPSLSDGAISVYFSSLHKWGMSGHVGSLIYLSDDFIKKYPVAEAGWLSIIPRDGKLVETDKNIALHFKEGGDQYLLGTFNLGVVRPLMASMKIIDRYPLEKLKDHVSSLQKYTDEKFEELNCDLKRRGAHLQFRLFGELDSKQSSFIKSYELWDLSKNKIIPLVLGDFDQKLKKQGVIIAIRQERIRISTNIFNDKNDVDRLMVAISSALNS